MTSSQRRYVGPALAIFGFVAYFLLARLGGPLSQPGEASAFWPAAGFLVVMSMSTAPKWWPWWIGGSLVEVGRGTISDDWDPARIAIAAFAVTLLPVVTGVCVRWFNGNPPRMTSTMARFKGLVASLIGCAVSAVPGSIAFAWDSNWDLVWEQMKIWFIGDMLAALVIPPLVLAVILERDRFRRPEYCFELAAHVAVTALVSALVFWTKFPVMAVIIAPLVIAAYRLEVVGAAATLLVATLSVSLATADGQGALSLAMRDGYDPLPAIQIFIASVGLTVLLLSSEVARVRMLGELRRDMAIIATQADDSVRDEIAQGLHDGPIQVLSAVALRLETRALGATSDGAISDETAVSQIRSAATTLRSLIFELAPGIKTAAELRTALERDATSRFSPTVTTWNVDVEEPLTLPGSVGSTLYRVACESMANVQIHAKAQSVSIVVRRTNTGVLLQITDDGIGAHHSVFFKRRSGHRGLLVLRARVTSEGGWLDLDSTLGQGTQIKAWLPNERTKQAVLGRNWGGSRSIA
jgi:signal transduction histidine kinase